MQTPTKTHETPTQTRLFRADAVRLEKTIRSVTAWLNKKHRDHSTKYTDRTKELVRSGANFSRSEQAARLWEELCHLLSDRWAPQGFCFDMLGEPDADGQAWYGWSAILDETAERAAEAE